MADPFREKRVVRRGKAVFQKNMPGSWAARQGGINSAFKSEVFFLERFTEYYDVYEDQDRILTSRTAWMRTDYFQFTTRYTEIYYCCRVKICYLEPPNFESRKAVLQP